MKPKLIATTVLFLLSASANAARVESEEVQSYGTQANKMRTLISAKAAIEGEQCDFGEPSSIQSSRRSTSEPVGRAVCHAV